MFKSPPPRRKATACHTLSCFDAEAVTADAAKFYVAMKRLKTREFASNSRISKKDMLELWEQREVEKNYVQEEIWLVKKSTLVDTDGNRIDLSKDLVGRSG